MTRPWTRPFAPRGEAPSAVFARRVQWDFIDQTVGSPLYSQGALNPGSAPALTTLVDLNTRCSQRWKLQIFITSLRFLTHPLTSATCR